MAGLDRETRYAALATRIGTVAALTGKVYRRLPPGPDAPVPAEQPCAFLPMNQEVPRRTPRGSTIWTLTTEIIVYARTDDQSAAPGTALAQVVQSIETALQMQAGDLRIDPGSSTTLGGLVESCDMGTVQYGEGADTGQGIAFVPITIIAADQ